MILYVDLIYLTCVTVNFLMLYLHSRFLSVKLKKRKILMGAVLGGFLSLQSLIFKVNIVFIFFETFLILRLIYGKCGTGELIRRFCVLFGLCLLFGASINLFSGFCVTAIEKDNRLYGVFPVAIYAVAVIMAYVIAVIFLFFIKHKKILYRIEMVIDGEVIKTTAFLDTGNRLREQKSQKPVIIIEEQMLGKEHEREKIYLKTVGNAHEEMDLIHVKSLTLLDENRGFYDLYAGVAKHSLSKNGEFHALLHSEFAN